MRRYTRKTIKKLMEGRCFFCDEPDLKLLDCHRILSGPRGGTYDWINVLVVCSLCHRKIHAGRISVDRKYASTAGIIVHFWEDGVEHWRPEARPHFDAAPSGTSDRTSSVRSSPSPSMVRHEEGVILAWEWP